ncbi:hypothetical protein ATI61_118169 [Archangium gephyra]|uniref:Outer membrane protein beta-barrel domain-containing protein n=1 Tax=Archangium gephyra TaxID=48 RepID=A0AAC8Q8S4_9BACT|nr:outer membrane beta-barrel protein [Archangium gephyra]AKJ03160.1 Hypothetical protein AA314_04786 [Archangium gephyra]REG22964.1 hypothetical protein ATI61_118169 [Archangium gephyra]
MRRLTLLALLLAAGSASAQDDEEPLPLNGVGRISVQAGWRLSSNGTFYDSYYALPSSQGFQRAPESPGGPFLAGSFAYSVTEFFELGIDLFATGEQLRLTGAPTITNVTYGALVGVRLQTLLDILTPEGVVPFVGVQTGPTLAYSVAEGVGSRELFTQAWAGTVGATFRFSPQWGLTAEYRLAFARGQSVFNNKPEFKGLASYNAGGNWFALGVTYFFASDPIRPFSSSP